MSLPSYSSSDAPAQDSEPPPYTGSSGSAAAASATTTQQKGLLPPETLILTGDAIHSGTSASALQLYALSHNLAEVREFHTAIDLSRLDSRVNDASLRITSTRKRIHTLTRPPPITGTSFPYYLENPSRRGSPFAALEPHRRWRSSGYRLLKVGPGRGPADDRVLGVLFSVKARGQGRYDWREGSERGRVLGYETFVQGLCQMQIVEGLERGSRDLLVAAWCLRVYSEVLDGVPRPGGKCWLWPLLRNMWCRLCFC